MSSDRTIQRAAVTGAGGFIGSHLVESLLQGGAEVVAIVRPKSNNPLGCLANLSCLHCDGLRVAQADVLDRSSLTDAVSGCDTVFHLAAQISVPESVSAAELHFQTNAHGTLNLLCSAEAIGAERVVIVSSSEVYGGADTLLSECSVLTAKSPYAASKIAAEKLAQAFYFSRALPTIVVRPFNTFGPRQSNRALIPWIFLQSLHGSTVELGNTEPVRDYVFVTDTIKGLIAAATMDQAVGGVFNLATGIGWSVADIVSQIGHLLDRELIIKTDPTRVRKPRYEVWSLIGDASAAHRTLNWRPEISFGRGIAIMHSSLLKKADSA